MNTQRLNGRMALHYKYMLSQMKAHTQPSLLYVNNPLAHLYSFHYSHKMYNEIKKECIKIVFRRCHKLSVSRVVKMNRLN